MFTIVFTIHCVFCVNLPIGLKICRSNIFFISRQNMHAQKIRYAICQGLPNKLIYKDKGIESLKDKCNIYVSLIYWGDSKLSTVIPPISRQPE